jgi:hypothetical protein
VRPRLALALVLVLAVASPAQAAPPRKKAIWGPVSVNGVSQFPIYKDLRAGIYEVRLAWNEVATRQPLDARNPADPAYAWPAELDEAVAQGRAAGIRVAVMVKGTPSWANGGLPENWAPTNPQDYADFVRAAGYRYAGVHIWIVWGEPSRAENFEPLVPETRDRPLTPEQDDAPHRYAQILDAAYVAIKAVNRSNLVVGGNTLTTGDISALNWIRNLRLPDGRRPRMDLYGHNPFTLRKPDLRKRSLGHGFADFSDLDTLIRWVDRYLPQKQRGRKPLKLFLSEFLVPTDQPSHEFNFHVDRATQADWLKAALKITRDWDRIYTLGWYSLYDEAPNSGGDETHYGLIDQTGVRKPAYHVFKRG